MCGKYVIFLFTLDFELLWMLFVENFSKIPFNNSWIAFFHTVSIFYYWNWNNDAKLLHNRLIFTSEGIRTLLILWHRRSSACPPLAVSSSSWGPHHQTWDHSDCIPAPFCTPHTSLRSSRTSWSASSTRSSPHYRRIAQLRVRHALNETVITSIKYMCAIWPLQTFWGQTLR